MIPETKRLLKYMELHDVSYGIDNVARPLRLFFSSENRLLWFRHGYAVSFLMDTAYWSSEYHLARNYIVRPRRRDVAYLQTQLLIAQKEEAGIQLQAEELDLMAVAGDLNEIEDVNANCILMANLQQASTSGTQT
ncbi:hypothetical protein Tco_1273655, partial [Tanacetum coccineum]